MRVSILLGLAVAGVATAQSSTSSAASSTSSCAAQNIVDACLTSTKEGLNACASNDWDCLCTNVINVLTCYNNCPNDPDRSTVESQKSSWCGAASANPSTSTKVSASKTASSSSASSTGSSATTSGSSTSKTPTSTSSGSGASASSTGAAGLVSPATSFGALVGLFAIAGIAL